MDDIPPYPPIDPTTFDLIVIGTGLPESIIAAAASTTSKTVLHLDPNPFYGSHYSSLTLADLPSFLSSHSTSSSPPRTPSSDDRNEFSVLDLATRPLYSSIDISSFAPHLIDQQSRKFNLDVAGPRVFFCADKSIELILNNGANQYMEFKGIDATFVGDNKGNLCTVPDSKAAIFQDKKILKPSEKLQLMGFFKLVQGHLSGEHDKKISEEDLQSPFVDFLNKKGLSHKIKSSVSQNFSPPSLVASSWLQSLACFSAAFDFSPCLCRFILYAIAMADYDQEDTGVCIDLLKTKDGIDQLAMYNASIGRFQNASGALIYPIYGHGELSQAFCRRAAVKGGIYVLRMPVTALLVDKDTGCYKGVKLASGQDVFSQKLVLDPTFKVTLPPGSSSPLPLQAKLPFFSLKDDRGKISRGICITNMSLKPDISNLLVVYPPRSLFPEQVTSIRLLQIASNLAVCPPGMFVLYISALSNDDEQGKKLIHAVMNTLLMVPSPINCESNAAVQGEITESGRAVEDKTAESSFTGPSDPGEGKPDLLWSALYSQELTLGQVDFICSTPMPDGKLNYNDLIDATIKLFQEIYPEEEFFPETSSENPEDDGDVSLET